MLKIASNMTLPHDAVMQTFGHSETSSGFKNAVTKLRTLEATEGYAKTSGVKAADVFFEM